MFILSPLRLVGNEDFRQWAQSCAAAGGCLRYNSAMIRQISLTTILLAIIAIGPAGCQNKPQPDAVARDLQAPRATTARWQTPFGDGTSQTTDHYVIYSTVKRPELSAALPGFMEAALANYCQLTGLPMPPRTKPMPLYMLSDRQQWAHLTRQIVKSRLDIYLSIDAGGYCYRGTCVFWDIGGPNTFSLASHEGLHQFLDQALKNQLPPWLEEGLAACAEGLDISRQKVVFRPDRNLARVATLREAMIAGRWRPIEQLIQMDAGQAVSDRRPGAALEYYAQLWALAVHLRSTPQGRQSIERLISDAAAGTLLSGIKPAQLKLLAQNPDPAERVRLVWRLLFLQYVSNDLADFEVRYRATAKRLSGL